MVFGIPSRPQLQCRLPDSPRLILGVYEQVRLVNQERSAEDCVSKSDRPLTIQAVTRASEIHQAVLKLLRLVRS